MGKNLKGIVVLLLVLVLLCSCAAGSVKAVKLDSKTQEIIERDIDDYIIKAFPYFIPKYKVTIIEKPLDNKLQNIGTYKPNCYWACIDFDEKDQDSDLNWSTIRDMALYAIYGLNGNFKEVKNEIKTVRYVIQYTNEKTEACCTACITKDGEVIGDSFYTELFDNAEVGHFNEYFENKRK